MIDLSSITSKPVEYFLAVLGALIFVFTRERTWMKRITSPLIGGFLALGLSEWFAEITGTNEIFMAVTITVLGQIFLEVGYALVEDRALMKGIAVDALKGLIKRIGG